MKLEVWKSDHNHEERHFFIPSDKAGYQSSHYVFGYNPKLIDQTLVDQIMLIIQQSVAVQKLNACKP